MPVRLGSRSFDILIQLLWRAGEVVSKEELLQAVWPGVLVDEGSVRSTFRRFARPLPIVRRSRTAPIGS
ncbi:transcriptional regulator [Variovorax sp. UC122_21]|uniref:winged helix-turn-helix domain-containing protein n=1 Tax=Variovorax sp. UC122_21 TaxID=3374554 RepID=UPI003757F474